MATLEQMEKMVLFRYLSQIKKMLMKRFVYFFIFVFI